ncbi:MAG: YjbF family lipoprotein [Rhizomicrobium sp.]
MPIEIPMTAEFDELQIATRGRVSRRVFFAAALAPLLARCSSDPNSDTAGLTRMLGQSFAGLTGKSSVTLKEVADTPFASLGVRVGSGAQTMLVLATRDGDSTVWTSASHIGLEMRRGRILRTAGLPQNLSATVFSGSDPLEAGVQNLHAPASAKRSIDLADRNAFGLVVESTVAPAGPADVDVLGTRIACVHAVERCICAALKWNFTNEYWADTGSGRVWRSTQFIDPDLDAVEIELFRPPELQSAAP